MQRFDDPFGDGPFRAIPSMENLPAQSQNILPASSFHQPLNRSSEGAQLAAPKAEIVNGFGDDFPSATNIPSSAASFLPPANMQYSQQEQSSPNPEIDILADILPPTGTQPLANSQTAYPAPTVQPSPQVSFPPQNVQTQSETGFSYQPVPTVAAPRSFSTQSGQPVGLSFPAQPGQPLAQANFQAQSGQLVPQNFHAQITHPASLAGFPAQAGQASQTGFPTQTSQTTSVGGFPSQMVSSPQAGFHSQSTQQNGNFYGSYNPQMGSAGPVAPLINSQVSSGAAVHNNSVNFLSQSGSSAPASVHTGPLSPQVGSSIPVVSQTTVSLTAAQPAKDKFETKSTVWADTLSRGLVNLNISGCKFFWLQ